MNKSKLLAVAVLFAMLGSTPAGPLFAQDLKSVLQSPSAKPKALHSIPESERLEIRNAQVQLLQTMLQAQPIEMRIQQMQSDLQQKITQVIKDSGRDPESFQLDVSSWAFVERPHAPKPPEAPKK